MPPPAAPTTNVALYLRRARLIDALRLRLRSPSTPSTPPLVPDDPVVALHAIRAAPTPSSALSLFRAFPPPPPLPLYHALASRLASLSAIPDLRALLASFPLPAPPLARLRLLAAAGDRDSALNAFASLSPPCRPAEAHNILVHLHARDGDHVAAVEAFRRMVREGALPNARTYTVVIEHLASAGFVDQALDVFRLLPSLRVRRTTRQYNVLAQALASAGRFDQLRWLVREMATVDGVMPGPQMRAAIAAMREAGHIDGTEDFVEELSPNARIGYAVDDVEGEGDSEEDDDEGEANEDDKDRGNRASQTLKPWLDPRELARALDGWDPREVAELEAVGLVWTPRLVCKLLRAFKKPATGWEFFCWVACRPGGFAHDRHTVARMVTALARAGHVELVERLLAKVRSDGILLPFATVRLVIDFYGLSRKADAATRVFRDAESICGPMSRPNLALLCSSLLRTMAKCRRGLDAMELLEEMMARDVLPDLQTFSGLMEHLAGAGDLKGVHRLLGLVRQCELQPDGYMYSVLVRAYCKRERAALALRVFDEMRAAGIAPDAPTKALLVKSLWREGKLREAALVEERCEEVAGGLPEASPGQVWTASAADLKKVLDIYSGSFAQPTAQAGTG